MSFVYSNCKEHKWPRSSPGGHFRSIGSVIYEQCNNCLAMKINFSTLVANDDDGWTEVRDEQIVEPRF